MKLRRILMILILVMVYKTAGSIDCFYCLNCTLPSDTRKLFECSYKFTHCAAVHVTIENTNASLFVCGLAKTCSHHFTEDAFQSVNNCYICDQDYCNAFIGAPFSFEPPSMPVVKSAIHEEEYDDEFDD